MLRNAVEFHAVSKVYRAGVLARRRIDALRDVTLQVRSGAVFGVVGPNRAGKTTLVKVLLSICRPTSGTVMRLDRPVRDRSTLARIGYLHESQAFPQYLSASQLLEYYGRLSFLPRRDIRRRAGELLQRFALGDRAHEPIANFSKGMLQRLSLAQTLVNDPELLVLDEPSEGMDLLARKLLHEVIGEHRRHGGTTLLISHSMADIERLCDEVAVLRGGEVVFAGSLEQLSRAAGNQSAALEQVLEPIFAGQGTCGGPLS